MKRWIPFLFVSALLLTCMPAFSQNTALASKVEAYLKPLLDEDLISGSVLIAKGDAVLVSRGFGPANREYNQPCTPETRFRLASVSKQFTATAIMMLEEAGKLSVEDSLSQYIPDYPRGGEITLHHLLTHTSGVINYSRLEDHYRVWCMPHTLEQVIDRFKQKPLQFNPGERWAYSNSGYVLLTYIIEKVSGLTYEEYLKQHIFKPLDMAHSGVDRHTAVIPKRATGHYNDGQGIVQAPYLDMAYTSGAGGLYATTGDLYKWDRALYGERLISESSKKRMFTPYKAKYGYGWFITEMDGHRLIEHRGGLNGFLTQIYRFVDDDVVVITLFNYVSTFTRQVNRDLAALALGGDVPPVLIPEGVAVEARALEAHTGTYRLQPGYDLTVTVENGQLSVSGPGEPATPGIAQSANRFYLRKDNALIEFTTDDDGSAMLLLYQSEHRYRCKKSQEN